MSTPPEVDLVPASLAAQLAAQLAALPHGSPDQAFIRRYLGTPRPVLGVSSAEIARLARNVRKEHAGWGAESWLTLLDHLYAGGTFEERALAGKLLGELKDVRRALDLARLRAWLAGQTGWAEVDTTCQSGWTPAEVLVRWAEWQPFLSGLAHDEKISLRRASLVLLVSPLRASADERLTLQALANVEQLQGEKSPLIVKAISWVLRSMAQQQPELVRSYLDAHAAELPASAVRETRKKLATGRKTPRT
jgi:3-methyladenine DNA glycosylase AlkD